MKTNNSGLDEMQKERRNNIGNQTFMLMSFALFIDIGLYGFGFRWLDYPSNIMVIIVVCMAIYLVRTITANAYLPPRAQNRKTILSLIITIVSSVALAIAAVNLFGEFLAQSGVEGAGDHSALILFIVSGASLLISLIAAIIKKVNDRNDSDD